MEWNKTILKKAKERIFEICLTLSGAIFGVMAMDLDIPITIIGIALYVYIATLKTAHDYSCKRVQ